MSDTTDIGEAQQDDPEALREALLEQMAYLVDEVEALQKVVGDLPEEITSGRPTPDALTMKELYGAIATLDADIRKDRVEQISSQDEPTLEPVDIDSEVRESGWNEKDLPDILDQLQDARERLVGELGDRDVDAWLRTAVLDGETVTLFDLVHRMTQADADRLRELGYRLHGAHLSDRDKPLPT